MEKRNMAFDQVKLRQIQAKLHAAITHNPPERCLLTVEEAQASLEVVEHQLYAQAPASPAKE
jgi:hypothetical protein